MEWAAFWDGHFPMGGFVAKSGVNIVGVAIDFCIGWENELDNSHLSSNLKFVWFHKTCIEKDMIPDWTKCLPFLFQLQRA